MEEKEHPFVEEHIVPSKRKLQKEFLKSVGRIFLYGAVFGVAAGVFFVFVQNLFQDGKQTSYTRRETESDVVNASSVEKPEDTAVKQEKEKKDNISVKTAENGDSYQKKIKEWNQSIVSIASNLADSGNSGLLEGTATFGAAIEENSKNVFFLSSYSSLPADIDHLQVFFSDGVACPAKLAGMDADVDLAVISVAAEEIPERTRQTIEIMKIGGMGQFQTGNDVVFLGCPNGTVYSMDIGIISGQLERTYIIDYCVDLYPTNMIRNENGAGVIVNADGKLLGMVNSVLGSSAHNSRVLFSSISSLKKIIDKIVEQREILYCGVKAEDIPQQQRAKMGITNGIYVMEVDPNSPADKAGIRTGDIIQKVQDTEITSVIDFYTEISRYNARPKIQIGAVRRVGRIKQDVDYTVILEEKK